MRAPLLSPSRSYDPTSRRGTCESGLAAATAAGKPNAVRFVPALRGRMVSVKLVQFRRVFSSSVGVNVYTSSSSTPHAGRIRLRPRAMLRK